MTFISISIYVSGKRGKKPTFKTPEKLEIRTYKKKTGSDLELNCEAIGDEPIIYHWYKNTRVLRHRATDSWFEANQPVLKLQTLVLSDSANYTCRAENKYGNVSSNLMMLTVQG